MNQKYSREVMEALVTQILNRGDRTMTSVGESRGGGVGWHEAQGRRGAGCEAARRDDCGGG